MLIPRLRRPMFAIKRRKLTPVRESKAAYGPRAMMTTIEDQHWGSMHH